MEKINTKEYVTISDVGYGDLVIGDKTYTKKQFRNNTNSILCACRKAELNYLFKFVNKDLNVDFMLVCGRIEFLIEKEAAVQIMDYYKQELQKAKIAPAKDKYKAWVEAKTNVINYIRENFSDCFSNYALVDFYDTIEYFGSMYDECDSYDSERPDLSRKSFAKGMINISDYLKKIKALKYVEGVNPEDVSISTPVDFLEQSFHEGTSSYFGYAIPYTNRAKYGKNKKMKESK